MTNSNFNDADQRYAKSWFLADLALCESYLQVLNLTPACDFSVSTLIIRSILGLKDRPEVSDNLGVLDRVRVLGMNALASEVVKNPRLVWITCGSQISGLPLREKYARDVLTDGMVVGVASASAFNAGYAGLVLYEWNDEQMEQKGMPGRSLVKFYGGVIRGISRCK
jgi:hypothetical protein